MTSLVFNMMCGVFRAAGYSDGQAIAASFWLMALAVVTNLYVLMEFVL